MPSQFYLRPPLVVLFNFSHKRPTFAFTAENGYTLGSLRKIAHKGTHGETGRISDWVLSLPSERSARSRTSPGRVSERRTLPLLGLGRWCSQRTQKASGTAMRLCASLFRGVAAPLGCVIPFSSLSKLRFVHPVLRAFCACAVGMVSLPSACSACSRNAGRPLVKATNLPFSEVGWSSLIPMVQNVLDRYSLLMIDFKYQKSIISRPAKKGGTHGRLQTGRC